LTRKLSCAFSCAASSNLSLSIMNRVLAFYTIVILNTSLISGIGSMIIKDLLLYFQCDQETPFA
jgi:hypothetical protein